MSPNSSKSVSFEEPRAASVSSSTKSMKAESIGPYGKKHHVAGICYPTGGKWDWLRPTTKPYSGFGGMVDFADSAPDADFAGTKEDWTRDIHHKRRSS
jgi:hypothetical protein